MKLNRQIFHDFFYRDGSGKGKSATSYRNGHFFSYRTEIGMIYNGSGRPVCFIADNNFSNTTAAHVSALRDACPLPVIRVPFEWGDDFTYRPDRAPAILLGRFSESLESYRGCTFNRRGDRDDFKNTAYNLRNFLEVTRQELPEGTRDLLRELEERAEDTPEQIARRRAAAAAAAKKTREKRAKERAEYAAAGVAYGVDPENIATQALIAFGDRAAFLADPGFRTATRDLLRHNYPGCSFVFASGDAVRTSQGVVMTDLCRLGRIYRAYTAGKIRPGFHVGPYAVREVTPEYVQIGCHRIPTANIRQLAASLNWDR